MAPESARRKRILSAIEALRELADRFDTRRAALARGAGLTVEGWRALEEIASAHFVPSMFAQRRRSSAAAVSKILAQLSRAGLVRPSVAKHDARGRTYALTAKGLARLAKLRAARIGAIDAIWASLNPREVAAFTRFAIGLIARIDRFDSAPHRVAIGKPDRRR